MQSPTATTQARPPKKPIRIWILQLDCLFQIGRHGYAIVTTTLEDGPPGTANDFVWLGSVLLVILLALLLFLATQRWAPRPAISAPAMGVVWWVDAIYYDLRDVLDPRVETNAAFLAGSCIAHALTLFFVVSLFVHRKTRDYLVGLPPASA